jgi:hypothetical protein
MKRNPNRPASYISGFADSISGLLSSCFCACLLFVVPGIIAANRAMAQSTPVPTAEDPKMSSILVELRQAVTQRSSGAAADRAAIVQSFSISTMPRSVSDAVLTHSMQLSPKAEVQTDIEMISLDAANLAALTNTGVVIEIEGEPNPLSDAGRVYTPVPTVQAEIPVEALQQVEELPFVRFLHLPNYRMSSASTPSLTTQGDSILRAYTARSTFGVTGAGVHVGVISSGIGGLFQSNCTSCAPVQLSGAIASPILSGDLPGSSASTGTRNSSNALTGISTDVLFAAKSFRKVDGDLGDSIDGANGAEGSAMLEIIHHLAPGASLSFANADSDMEFEAAVNYLASMNDIVVDDESFLAPSYDGTSAVSQNTTSALNNPANPIRAYVTAAGNYALNHFLGAFTDSGVDGFAYTGEHGDLHQFSGVVQGQVVPPLAAVTALNTQTIDNLSLGKQNFDPLITLPVGGIVKVGLSWDDPSNASSNDFDLFLVPVDCTSSTNCSFAGTYIASSTTRQTGFQEPYEYISYTNQSNAPQTLAVVIQDYQDNASTSTTHNFDMFIVGNGAKGTEPNHNYYTVTGSIPAQADAQASTSSGSPAVSVITVGAINQAQCDSAPTLATPDNCTGQLEVYSGQGPTQITPQNKTAAIKPNLTAVDQVCITGAGGFGFSLPTSGVTCTITPSNTYTYTPMLFGGTSAAAPHVAAIAALTLQMAPCLLTSVGAQSAAAAVFARQTLYTILTGLPTVTTTSGMTSTTTPAVQYASPLSGYDLSIPTTTTTSYPFGVPNSAEGWGLVDAYSSGASLLPVPTAQNTLAVSTTQPNPNLIASVSAIDASGATATLTSPTKLTNVSGCPVTNMEWAPQPGTMSTLAAGYAQGTQATAAFPIGITPVVIAPSINNGVTFPPINIVPAANVVVTDFNLTVQPSTPAPVTVPAGTPAVFIVTATSLPTGPFTNPVSLSCQLAGLPAGAMCVFSPAVINPSVVSGSGVTQAATSTLTIYTSGVVGAAVRPVGIPPARRRNGQLLYATLLMVGLLRWSARSRRALHTRLMLLTAMAIICLGSLSCGTPSTPAPTATTYTVTVIGTSDQLVHTASLTVIVQ